MYLPTPTWQPPRVRRRGQRGIVLKRVGLAFLLLGGSSLTARHTRADDVLWSLSGDGFWDVAANWTAYPPGGPPTQRVPTSSDDAVNLSDFLISLANTGYANSFTTEGSFNLTGSLYLTTTLSQFGSSVFANNGGHLVFTGSSGLIQSGNVLMNGGYVGGVEGTTLTLDSNTLVHGGGGGYVGTYTTNSGGNLVNNGTISADVSGQTLNAQAGYNQSTGTYGALTSTGTLQATNGGTLYVAPSNAGTYTIGGNVTADGAGSTVYLYGTGTLNDATTFKASNSGLVYLNGTYDSQRNSITIADGSLSFNGGTLRNSTVNLSGTGVGLDFSTGSGTLDSVTVNGAINVANSDFAYILNNLTATNITVNTGHLYFETDSLLKSGNVTLNGGYIGADAPNHTLTLDSSTLVHGGSGYVGSYNSTYGGNLVNNGTISADVSGQALNAQGGYGYDPALGYSHYGTLTSTGTLQAVNGATLYVTANGGGTIGGNVTANGSGSALYLYGTENLADATTFKASNTGHIYLAGDYDNQGNTITIADGSLSFNGGTLRNSTVNLSGTGVGLDFSTGSGTLDNVTINGALNVSTNYAYILNNLTAANGITLDGGHLYFETDSTLHGGNVAFTGNGGFIGADAPNHTLTLDSSTLVHGGGSGYVGTYNSTYGGNLVNNGTISADVSGQALNAQGGYGYDPNTGTYHYGTLTSTGTLQAVNGATLYVTANGGGTIGGNVTANGSGSGLYLYGTENLADATTFTASNGGLVSLRGDYDNQNHSITIADGSLSFNGGTLRNSTVNLTGGGVGLDFSTGSGTLDNVTINGSLNVAGNYAYILNNLNVANGITLDGGHLYFETDSTLRGGNVTFTSNGGYIGADAPNHTLTLDSSTLVHGGGSGYVGTYNSTYGGNLVNNGTISADVSGQALNAQGGYGYDPALGYSHYGTFTSTGTLQATNGGTLYVGPNNAGTYTLGGNITADGAGSTIYLSGTGTLNNGTLFTASNSGLIYLRGDYDNQGHSITIADGPLSFNNGTLRNSTVNLTGGSTGLGFSTGSGTLDNVTINGDLNVSTNYVYILNNLNVANGITLDGGHIEFLTDGTLHGGNVVFTNNGGYIGADTPAHTLTLDSSTLVHGGGNGYVGTYNSNNGGSLVNNGTISADVSGQALNVQPGYEYDPNTGTYHYGALTNNGTLQAVNGGTLYVSTNGGGTIGGNVTADGTGSNLYLYGAANLADATTFTASNSGLVHLGGTYDNQGHTITTNGPLSFYNGTLNNSTVNGTGVDFSTGSGTLNNVTLNSDLTVSTYSAYLNTVQVNGNLLATNNGYAIVTNNLNVTGSITLDGGNIEFLTDSLLKSGNVVFTGNGGNLGADAPNLTLTLDSSTLVHGGGNGTVGSDYHGILGGSLVNNGTISADVSGQALNVQPGYEYDPNTGTYHYGALTNNGTLQAVNGGTLNVSTNGGGTIGGNVTADGTGSNLYLYGAANLADATTFTASNSGLVHLGGNYDNQGHTITTNGPLSFAGGTLNNSTVNGTGVDFSTGSGTLNNVTLNNNLTVSTYSAYLNTVQVNGNFTATNGGYAYVLNNLNVTGNTTLDSGHVQYQSDNILTGGNVLFTGNGGYIGADAPNHTLTLDSSTLVHGGGNGIVGSYNSVLGGNLVNNGTISADVSGQTLNVQPGYGNDPNTGTYHYGTLTNNGTLQSTNGGTLNVTATSDSGTNTGTIRADAGSTISLNNITQTSGQTVANGNIFTNSNFNLKGGSFIGDGVVSGPLANTGATVSPGTLTTAGHLTINGNYSQGSNSQLLIKLGGTIQGTNFDLLSVNGAATLDGTLGVQLIGGFTPTVGETFDFFNYNTRIGDFAAVTSLNNGYAYDVTYNDISGIGTIHVESVPETGTVVSLGILLCGGGWVIRRMRRQSEKDKRAASPLTPA